MPSFEHVAAFCSLSQHPVPNNKKTQDLRNILDVVVLNHRRGTVVLVRDTGIRRNRDMWC